MTPNSYGSNTQFCHQFGTDQIVTSYYVINSTV